MIRALTHLVLHFAVPGAIARLCYPATFVRAFLIMAATMLIDVDHLLADPVYDPARCSIGFHPLHQYPLFAVYAMLAIVPATRIVGIGLVIHMVLDGIDCVWIAYEN